MKKILIFNVLFAFLFSYVSFAQEEENAETEEEVLEFMVPKTDIFDKAIVEEKKPIEYAEIREENVLWSQFVWRIIDCREKLNLHLYFPIDELPNRKSLAQTLVEGVIKKKIQAYSDEDFKEVTSITNIMERLGAGGTVRTEEKMDGSGDTTIVEKGFVKWNEVREYAVKEKWFFDKKHSKFDVRIIAVCPIRVYTKKIGNEEESEQGNEVRERLFWVYFPEARRVLANTTCYSGKNQTANISFDDVFHKRFFSSRITRTGNVNELEISKYTRGGFEALLESERIKTEMLQLESDFWSY
jgi:gliding motility associated protien GldN